MRNVGRARNVAIAFVSISLNNAGKLQCLQSLVSSITMHDAMMPEPVCGFWMENYRKWMREQCEHTRTQLNAIYLFFFFLFFDYDYSHSPTLTSYTHARTYIRDNLIIHVGSRTKAIKRKINPPIFFTRSTVHLKVDHTHWRIKSVSARECAFAVWIRFVVGSVGDDIGKV